MENFLIKAVSAGGFGMDYAPQADITGGQDSMYMFWVVAGILVVAGIIGLFVYSTFYD